MVTQLKKLIFVSLLLSMPAFAQSAFFTIRAAGDTMMGDAPSGQYPDHNPLYEVEDELLDADFTFLNLEGPLCDQNIKSPKCKNGSKNCHAFRTPTSFVNYLVSAGIDAVNLANNHIFDYGKICADETKTTLLDNKILFTGVKENTKSTPETAIVSTVIKNTRLALIGFHAASSYGLLLSFNKEQEVKSIITNAKKSHDLVIVTFHGGGEGATFCRTPDGREYYCGEDRGDLRKFSRSAIDAGADAVIGHGPHVLRGMEIYKNKLIAYSLGNFATYSKMKISHPSNMGVILELSFDENKSFIKGKIIPTKQFYITKDKKRVTKLVIDNEQLAIKEITNLSNLDFPNGNINFSSSGEFFPNKNI